MKAASGVGWHAGVAAFAVIFAVNSAINSVSTPAPARGAQQLG